VSTATSTSQLRFDVRGESAKAPWRCAICRVRFRPNATATAFLAGTRDAVCDGCGDAHGARGQLRQARDRPITDDELARARRAMTRDPTLARLEPQTAALVLRAEEQR
jgi:hypothetical protein